MNTKINISDILNDHILTIRNANTKSPSIKDYFVFLWIPLLIATTLTSCYLFMGSALINSLVAVLSIFVALLLNLMMILFDITKKRKDIMDNLNKADLSIPKSTKIVNDNMMKLLKETHSNISFAILIALTGIIPLFLSLIDNFHSQFIFNWISYFFLTALFLTILTILKRIHLILKNEFK